MRRRRPGTHCPGCSFGFWYAFAKLRALQPRGPLTGVSGGALAAACYLCGLDPMTQLAACRRLRPYLVATWDLHGTVRRWLTEQLPENCVRLCEGRLTVFTRRYPCMEVRAFDRWSGKAHLVETLVAAASPLVPLRVRGEWLTDSLWVDVPGPQLAVEGLWAVPDARGVRELIRRARADARREQLAPVSLLTHPVMKTVRNITEKLHVEN